MSAGTLPRWDVTDIHASLDARSFHDHLERSTTDVGRLVALFDELGIRAVAPRPATARDGEHADQAIAAYNRVASDYGTR
jgi:hypothetical protein